MTDETMMELRRGIDAVVRGMGLKDAILVATDDRPAGGTMRAAEVTVYLPDDWPVRDLAPLTPFQQMCLSGLIGDERQLPAAVADWLLEQGYDWATAVVEKARAEEREKATAGQVSLLATIAQLQEQVRVLTGLIGEDDPDSGQWVRPRVRPGPYPYPDVWWTGINIDPIT